MDQAKLDELLIASQVRVMKFLKRYMEKFEKQMMEIANGNNQRRDTSGPERQPDRDSRPPGRFAR